MMRDRNHSTCACLNFLLPKIRAIPAHWEAFYLLEPVNSLELAFEEDDNRTMGDVLRLLRWVL